MSDLIINIRFGTRHFQVAKWYGWDFESIKYWFKRLSFGVNEYHVKHKPAKFFQVHDFFWYRG